VKNSIKKIITLYGASIFAIALGFLLSIFNSRILGPELFGDYKFIQTVATLIASVVAVGFFVSLTRLLAINDDIYKERKYIGLFVVIFAIVSLIGIVLFIAFSFIEPYYFNHGLDSEFRIFFFIVPAIIGLTAMKEILKGMHKIYLLALLSFLPALFYLIIVYPASFYVTISLNQVLLISYSVTLVLVGYYIKKLKPDFSFKKRLKSKLFIENKYNGKPIYFGSLAGVTTEHIAGVSISFFMDNIQVGFFVLALTICRPLLVIPSVIATVYFKQFATLKKIPKKVFSFSILGTLAALLVFYLFIEKVIETFYSVAYLPVYPIAKFLIVAFIFHGLGDLFNRFLGAKGKGKLLRNAAYLVGIVNVFGYTVLVKYFDLNGAIFTKIAASGLYMLVMCYYYFSYIKNKDKKLVIT